MCQWAIHGQKHPTDPVYAQQATGRVGKDGVNAIIFQVRAECDALYESQLEP